MNILTKIGSDWSFGFREEDENVKVHGRRRRTISDDNTSHDPRWAKT